MSFKTKKVQTQDLGEYLAACRARANFTPEEAAKFSGVAIKFVRALEEGRMQDLPASVYVRGFLRSLCRIYRIEAGTVLEQFTAESSLVDRLQIVLSPEEQQRPREQLLPRFVLTPKVLTAAGISVLGLMSLAYLYFQVSTLRRPPALTITSPVADGVVESSHVQVAGKAEAGAAIFINDQPVASDTDGRFDEALSLAPGTNQIVITAKNKFGQETVIARSLVLPLPKEIAGAATGVMVEVAIGDEDARVVVEADDAEVFSGTMLPGSRQSFSARDRIRLSTTNAGAVRVTLNGKDLGVLGKKGESLNNIEFGE